MKLKQVALTGAKRTSDIEVSDALFVAEVNHELLSQAVRVYRSNQRQGGAVTQTRSEVSRTKTKWYRQKGTGRARHGARSANLFVGGGVAHGPTGQENWKKLLPTKMRVAALRHALTAQVGESALVVGTGLDGFTGKTKEAVEAYARLSDQAKTKALLVVAGEYQNLLKSARNHAGITLMRADRLNALDVVSADQIVILKEALEVLEERLSSNKATKVEVKAEVKPATKTIAKKAAPKSSVKSVAKKSTKSTKKTKEASA